jgi:hypothetical protein
MKTLAQIYAKNRMKLRERNKRLLGARVHFDFNVSAQIGDQVDSNDMVCVHWSGDNYRQYVSFYELRARFLEPGYVTRVEYPKKVLLKDYFA